jgi:DNA-binding NarL/FixJ family response regulator
MRASWSQQRRQLIAAPLANSVNVGSFSLRSKDQVVSRQDADAGILFGTALTRRSSDLVLLGSAVDMVRELGGIVVGHNMNETAHIRVLCVDDHPLLQQGLAAAIRDEPDMLLVAQAATGQEAIRKYRENIPDVTLLDLRLPDMSGIDAMIAIRSEFPEARIVILTTFAGDAEIQRALAAGARGYVLKSTPPKDLMDIIRQVNTGKKRIPSEIAAYLAEHYSDDDLTGREIEVLTLIADGRRNREIAERLFISEETVKVHVKHIMEKLDAADRTQAVAIAVRRGIIHL